MTVSSTNNAVRRHVRLGILAAMAALTCLGIGCPRLRRDRTPSPAASHFVSVRGAGFVLNGRPWFPYGVNYWPNYAVNPPPPFTYPAPEYWLGSANYQAAIIEEDMAALESLGVNCISTQASLDADTWPALQDFLSRCLAHRIRVSLAFTRANPFKPEFDGIDAETALDDIVPALGLATNKAIFAYDIAYEPYLGRWGETRWRYDGLWSRFIAREFGGVAAAQASFGRAIDAVRAGRAAGIVSHTIPVRAVAGQVYPCQVVMRNMGDVDWTVAGLYRLGTVIGEGTPGRVDLAGDVAAGFDATFSFNYTAPADPGRHRLRLSVLQELVTWFGPVLEWEVEVIAAGNAVQQAVNYPQPVLGPTDAELQGAGPDLLVNAFRRCMDTETATRFGRVARRIRHLDPNHLVWCRQGWGGNGNPITVPFYPLELHATAYHLDFLGPENYEFMGTLDSNTVLSGCATTGSYCRWAGGGKPVVWAEAAYTSMVNPTAQHMQDQSDYYSLFIDHMLTTQADGVQFWWWPGGTRLDENSDFGVTNGDRTQRPAAVTLSDRANDARSARPSTASVTQGAVDLMAAPGGFPAIYAAHRPAALAAVLAGDTYVMVGDGDGTTSDQAPAVVGGIPKYLWAEITKVELQVGAGDWFEVRDGMAYAVAPGTEIRARATVVNMGDTTWLPQSVGVGAVAFAGNENRGLGFRSFLTRSIPRMSAVDVPAFTMTNGIAIDTVVQFQMIADGVSWITGSVQVLLIPVP